MNFGNIKEVIAFGDLQNVFWLWNVNALHAIFLEENEYWNRGTSQKSLFPPFWGKEYIKLSWQTSELFLQMKNMVLLQTAFPALE